MRSPSPLRPMLLVMGVTLAAALLHFSAAAGLRKQPFSLPGLAATLAVLAVWFVQVRAAALKRRKSFCVFMVLYWVLGFLCMLMLPLSVRTGVPFLAVPAFVGLMMLYVPLYALIPLAEAVGMSYLWIYPIIFILLAGVYLYTRHKSTAVQPAPPSNTPAGAPSTKEAAQELVGKPSTTI